MTFPPAGGNQFPTRPRNTLGFSLGAVGGPRGTGAGLTRVLLQYITQYDRGQLEQLSKDLKDLTQQQEEANKELLGASTRQKAIEEEINRARNARGNLDRTAQKAMKDMLDTQARARAEEQTLGRVSAATTAVLLERERTFRRLSGLSKTEQAALINQHSNQIALNAAKQQTARLQGQIAANELNINSIMESGVAMATVRAQLAGQVKNLFLGAIGGVVGGAVIGAVLYEPLQAVMNGVTQWAKDVVDPANRARDALDEVGQEINALIDEETLTRMAAVNEWLEGLGTALGNVPNRPGLTAAAQAQALKERNDALEQALLLGRNGVQLLDEQIERTARLLLLEDQRAGIQRTVSREQAYSGVLAARAAGDERLARLLSGGLAANRGMLKDIIDWAYYFGLAGEAAGEITNETDAATDAIDRATAAAADLRQELAQASIQASLEANISAIENVLNAAITGIRTSAEVGIDAIRARADAAADAVRSSADRRVDAIQDRMRGLEVVESRRTRNLEAALDALEDVGPSKRTRELADQIERLNNAQEKAAFRSRLAEIAEQRHQILLRERLRLSDKEINLNNYRGKDRLVAIDALLARMHKQNEAQDRFNKLLDIQYQINQGVRRQQGETIREFVERRAQYYRGLLQQAAELQREGPESELEAERDRVETTLELRELERRRKEIIEQRARDQYLDSLNKQLAASQERDRKELAGRREFLQKQLAESRKADQQRLEDQRQALQDQIENIRQRAADEIETINNRRDADIRAREQARDAAINNVKMAARIAIEVERQRAEMLRQWADYGETQRLLEAFKGARDMAELQRFAGALAGSNFSVEYIRAQLNALGVSPAEQAVILQNLSRLIVGYTERLAQLAPRPAAPPNWGPTHKDGGLFLLRNSRQNPFSDDIRYGEDGRDEIGMIFNNKILRELQGLDRGRGGGFSGDVIINESSDPYRDRYMFRREVEQIVDERLNH